MGILLSFVLAGFVLCLFAMAVLAALRVIGRLLLAASVSLLLGLFGGILLVSDSADRLTTSLLIGLALTIPIFALLMKRARTKRARTSSEAPAPEASQPFSGHRRLRIWNLRLKSSESRWTTAWNALSEEAWGSENRISIARRNCERFRSTLDAGSLDMEAHRLILLLDRHVPEHIETRLKAVRNAGPARHSMIEDLIDRLERIAAYCEKRLSWSGVEQGEDDILTAHIENHLNRSPLSAI